MSAASRLAAADTRILRDEKGRFVPQVDQPKPSPFSRLARRADVPDGVEVAVKYLDRWWATDEYPIGSRLAAELAAGAAR